MNEKLLERTLMLLMIAAVGLLLSAMVLAWQVILFGRVGGPFGG
jgi:hypothetical protein